MNNPGIWAHPAPFILAILVVSGSVWAVQQFDTQIAWIYAVVVLLGILVMKPEILLSFADWLTSTIAVSPTGGGNQGPKG